MSKTPSRQVRLQIGARVRSARKKRAMSQERLASLIERSTETVSSIERGISSPSLETLFVIAQRLDVPVRELLEVDLGTAPKTKRRLNAEIKLRDLVATLSDEAFDAVVGHAELVAGLQRRPIAPGRSKGR